MVVMAAPISTARLVKATRHHLGVTPGAPPPPPAHRKQPRPQHTGSLFGASYQTYQIFHNKHLNRLSLSALRTNGLPPLPPAQDECAAIRYQAPLRSHLLIRNVHSVTTLQQLPF